MAAHTAERRPMGALGRMGIVAAMHLGVFIVIGRALVVSQTAPPPDITAWPIDESRPVDERPPQVEPQMERPDDVVIPPPEVVITDDPPPDVVLARPQIDTGIEEGPGSAVVIPQIIGARPDTKHPLSQPPYPPSEVRGNHEGNADVEVYVLPNGRVGEARIVKSTGFERLDQATLEEARRNWRLIPATRAGVPIAQWYRLRVVFKLTNQ